MKKYRIYLSYNEIDSDGLSQIFDKYKDLSHGDIVNDFESVVKSLSGAQHAVALNTGTAALHLALKVLNVGMGDKVVVSTFTYVASVSPIIYCGASPVFIDSEPETWNMDPGLLEKALSEMAAEGKLPKAIIVVHAYGMPAQMDKILAVAKKWEVPVIEDAAEAFGATINGQWAGTMGDIGIYSYNNNKSITTFGGGVLVTNKPGWAVHARKLSTHAREDKPYYEHRELGYNYAMSPLNAAYGLLECGKIEKIIEQRRATFQRYRSVFTKKIEFQNQPEGLKSNRWLTTARLAENKRNGDLINQIIDNQHFEIRRVWNPMHQQPLFLSEKAYLNGVSGQLFQNGVCLPSGLIEEDEFQEMVQWLQSRF